MIPARVRLLGWVSFWADIASEMAYPVLPLFMKALGAPAVGLGVVEGLADATAQVLKGYSGLKSDQTGQRTPLIRAGYLLSALGKPLIAASVAWPMVVGARVLDRIGKGIRTSPRDALIADSVEEGSRGAAFGFHRAMDTAGAFVGVLVALLMLSLLPGNYRAVFIAALIPGLISVYLTLRVREEPREAVPPAERPRFRDLVRRLPRSFWWAVLPALLFALANSSDTFLLWRARDSGFSDTAVILAYAFYNLSYTLLSFPAGKLSDRIGRKPVLIASWLCYAAVYFAFSRVAGMAIWGAFFAYGVFQGLNQGVTKALILDGIDAELRGTALGAFSVVSGVMAFVGNAAAGWTWDQFGSAVMLQATAVLALIAVGAALVPRKVA
jgi:MFS family permease